MNESIIFYSRKILKFTKPFCTDFTRLRLGLSHTREHNFYYYFQVTVNYFYECGLQIQTLCHWTLFQKDDINITITFLFRSSSFSKITNKLILKNSFNEYELSTKSSFIYSKVFSEFQFCCQYFKNHFVLFLLLFFYCFCSPS